MSNTTDHNLITFNAISNFTKELNDNFGSKQRSLKLYCRLINKTTISHEKPIEKHIKSFRDFCIANRDAITSKDITKLVQDRVQYSNRVYIEFKSIFNSADNETKDVIWKHLLTISALVDPAGKAKEVLKQKSGFEADFLSNIINKVEENVDPNANPMEAVSSIMNSGVFTELIGGMNNGLQDGSLDLGKLMGTVQGMVSSLGSQVGEDGQGADAMNMINSLMGHMMKNLDNNNDNDNDNYNDDMQMPNLASLMGPMLAGLTGQNSSGNNRGLPDLAGMLSGLTQNNMNIEEKINSQITSNRQQNIKATDDQNKNEESNIEEIE